ncbi:helix-turn-helix domain-containing protein [Microbacteriaceae bacterium VKM Ac-2854]|nr:helix-turn-helix domain-containing protein [Microbacteriaceae bacterium VKM Ac-2854]
MERGELATVLRAWRDRLDPTEAGLPGGNRKSPGLRREELAMLAGLSVDYIVRLEQGRASAPSAQVVASLARALRLDAGETGHLYTAAGLRAPSEGSVPVHISPGVQRMVDRLGDVPLAIFSAEWTLLHPNPLWRALLGQGEDLVGRDRNIAWRHFMTAVAGIEHAEGLLEHFEAALVSDLRLAATRYAEDRGLARLIADLRAQSPAFERIWMQARVVPFRSERKRIRTSVGTVELDCDVLTVSCEDLRIVVYTAARGSDAADRLELLRVAGTQLA